MSTPIVCSDLSFSWPDGRTVFDGLDLVISSGRTGLIGANGSGNTTLRIRHTYRVIPFHAG
ncbi:MAG TPA: hypothetical protein VFO16_14345 [Pseudonocardiaceae bacterium]|nr:hypothetical protein [Pseudonocardiaceae bacterium]